MSVPGLSNREVFPGFLVETGATLNSNQPDILAQAPLTPKVMLMGPEALIVISALQPHDGPHCHVSQMP